MRLWLKFARATELSYISHLDAHRAFSRLLRRAGLPLAYSLGFNPHPLLSLAAPLPLGFGSEADYLDVTLARAMPLGDIAKALCGAAGSDMLKLAGLRAVPKGKPALASLVKWAEYTIEGKAGADLLDCTIARFLASPEVVFVKETKRGSRVVDAKGLVHRLTRTEEGLNAVLSMAEPAVLRPEELVSILTSHSEPWEIDFISRRELYIEELVAPLAAVLQGLVVEGERNGCGSG